MKKLEMSKNLIEICKDLGKGLVPGDKAWLAVWIPTMGKCPACDGSGVLVGKNGVEFKCPACHGSREIPITVEAVAKYVKVHNITIHASSPYRDDEGNEFGHPSVVYHFDSVEEEENRSGWQNSWDRSTRGDSPFLFLIKEEAEIMCQEMRDKAEYYSPAYHAFYEHTGRMPRKKL